MLVQRQLKFDLTMINDKMPNPHNAEFITLNVKNIVIYMIYEKSIVLI